MSIIEFCNFDFKSTLFFFINKTLRVFKAKSRFILTDYDHYLQTASAVAPDIKNKILIIKRSKDKDFKT